MLFSLDMPINEYMSKYTLSKSLSRTRGLEVSLSNSNKRIACSNSDSGSRLSPFNSYQYPGRVSKSDSKYTSL